MAITSLFGPTPAQIEQARQLQMDQQISGEGAELGPFRGLYQAGRRLGSAGTQSLVQGLFPESADPTIRQAQAVQLVQQKYQGQNLGDPLVLQQVASDLFSAGAPDAGLRILEASRRITPKQETVTVAPGAALVDPRTGKVIYQAPAKDKKDTITVPAGSTVIDGQGNVLFSAPKDVKADNKILPPGSIMVDSTGNVIARGQEPKGTSADVSPEWKRYTELLKLGTPEPEARATAYKTAALDFRKDLEEVRKQDAAKKQQDQFNNTAGIIDNVMNIVDIAVKQTGTFTAGAFSPLSLLPGTPATDLAANLETIRANLGFDRLQQMRDASPTGGALGQVAVQELVALQSTIASLDIKQSPAQLKKNLNKVKGHYNKWRETVKKATEQNASTSKEPAADAQPGWSIVR